MVSPLSRKEVTMDIAINKCFGGFGLSKAAYEELGIKWDGFGYKYSDNRTDPDLIRVIRKLGPKASGQMASVEIVTITDDVEWEIDEYDGVETVHEVHRSWG
jgi:hypothetical protein